MSSPVERWNLPTVDGPSWSPRREQPTVDKLQAIEQAAYEEAFAQGREAATAAVRKEMEGRTQELNARIAKLDAALSMLARPLAELDAQVEQQLATLAVTIARQLIRRELRTDPGQIIAVIRETIALLPAAARDVRLHLHPEDAALIRERLAAPAAERAWNIVEDPVLTRGGCIVKSEYSTIDARLEARLGSVISAVLGDERTTAAAGGAQP